MKNKSKFLSPKENKNDLIKNAVILIESFTESSSDLVASPETFLPKALLKFVGKTLIVWCKDTLSNTKNKLKKGEDLLKPVNKFVETLKFLSDNKITDEQLLEALRNLHVLTLSTGTTSEETLEIYILIDRLRELKGLEIAIILAAHNIYDKKYSEEKMKEITKDFLPGNNHSGTWCIMISRALGLSISDYISVQQEHLEKLELIAPRSINTQWTGKNNADYVSHGKFRLTDSGYRLAQFITLGKELA